MKPISKNIKIEEVTDAEVEITAEVPAEEVTKHYNKILEKERKDTEIDGFRKGKAPLEMVERKIGQGPLMQSVAESLLNEEYRRIIEEKDLKPLGRPEITITKIAPGNDLGFKIKTALMPEVELGDYKEIAKKTLSEKPLAKPEVSENEKKETIRNIRLSHFLYDKRKRKEEIPPPESIKEEDLPKLTDELVSSFGSFSDVKDFDQKIEKHLKQEKKNREKEKLWAKMIEAIIEQSTIKTPTLLIEYELEKMTAQLKDDIKRSGLEFSEYLNKINKTEEEIRSGWKENAKKRAQTQLILNTIATKENIKPDPEIVEAQTKQMLEHYKEARPENVRIFVETQLMNEKTLVFLSSLGESSEKIKKNKSKK